MKSLIKFQRIAAFALTLQLVTAAATAQPRPVDVTDCAMMLEADEARLACYDRIVLTEAKRQLEEEKGAIPKLQAVVNIAEKPEPAAPVKPFSERTFKRIDPADIRATATKWLGRDLEFGSANIYWVADDDLRVLTKENLTLFGRSASGSPDDLKYLKDNCETSKEAQSSKCRVRVRFSYSENSEDTPGGISKRTVLIAPQIELARLGKRGR